MSLPEAAAELARQVVIALAGDAGREERDRVEDGRTLRAVLAYERATRAQAERERDELRAERDRLLDTVRRFVRADDSVSGKYALQLADIVAEIDKRR